MKKLYVTFVLLFVSAICQADNQTFVANEGGSNRIIIVEDYGGINQIERISSYPMENGGSIGSINHPTLPKSWVYNAENNPPGFDMATAAALLDEAGWLVGDDGVRHCTGCKYTEPYILDTWQDENSSGLIFSLNNDLYSREVNPKTGNLFGPKNMLFNTPPGGQMVTACVDEDYFAAIFYTDRYFLILNALKEGRLEGDPSFYALGTLIIGLDCGENTGTFDLVGIELRNVNQTQQTRPFIVNWNEDFTVNIPSKALGPWTNTNPAIAYEQRFNSIVYLPVITKSTGSRSVAAAISKSIIYGKPGPNTLTPIFQAINPNNSKRGAPKKLPLPAGVWRSYATIKPFANAEKK